MINIANLDLKPSKGIFFQRIGVAYNEITAEQFKYCLGVACDVLRYSLKRGQSAHSEQSARIKIQDMIRQIDSEKGEYVSLMMYPTEEWYYEK
ncbi:hypothetical protein NVP2275O_060 [Vibrio phage 2.275.O._10N.286.54.E11]|nr:hypothetical protein NVP2275O_060 [Vibrio phage 2.275.O._10N.286.54.E11]